MLRTRVITAVILLLVLLAVLAYGGALGWNLFVLVVLLGAFWEWARLGQFGAPKSILYAIAGGAICLVGAQFVSLQTSGFPLLALASVFWVAFAPWCLRHVSLGVLANPFVYGAVGFVLIAAAGLALVVTKTYGIVFLLSAIAICFAADIFAYFSARRLANASWPPAFHPGKAGKAQLVAHSAC